MAPTFKGFEHELCYWFRDSACLLATMEPQERTQCDEVLLHFVSKAMWYLRSLPLESLQYQSSLESVANLKITLCDVGIAMELHERLKSSVVDRSRYHAKGRSSCTCFGRTVRPENAQMTPMQRTLTFRCDADGTPMTFSMASE